MSLSSYLKETRQEFKHVVWPSRKQTIIYTVAVILISVGVAYFLGAFDKLFATGLGKLLGY